MQAQTSIDRYKNFGLRDEWVSMYLPEGDAFWTGDHGLHPTYQVPSLKNWKIQCKLPPKTKRFCPLVLK